MLHFAVYGFYLLVAAVITYPLVAQLSSSLAGFVYGDGYEMAHHVWWFKQALQSGQNPFFQSLLAYPNGIEAVTLWANPLQSFPAWALAFVLPLPAAINGQILLTLALNGWAMFFLARYTVGAWRAKPPQMAPQRGLAARAGYQPAATAPALLAGLVFMLFPTMQGHVGVAHLGQIVQWTMPLYAYALLRLRATAPPSPHEPSVRSPSPTRAGRGETIRLILLAAGLLVLGSWGHTLQLIYVLLPITLVYALGLVWRREWLALRRAAAAVGLGGLLLGAFLIPVFRATLGTAAYVDEGGAVRYSADLLALVTPSFRHPLFGRLEYTHRVLGVNIDEGAAYVGAVAALLAGVALWKVRAARGWLALALLAWLFSLGPLLKIFDQPVTFTVDNYASYVTLPFALVGSLPLISLARAPGRFSFGLALAVAALAGYGAAYLWERVRLHRAIKGLALLALMAGIAFEYQVFFPLPTSPAGIPQAVADLAARDDIRAVLDLPTGSLIAAKYGMYLQTAHQRPLIAGHETRSTPVSPAKLALLEASLDPALLRSVGADAVILQREHDDGTLESRARARLGDPLYEDAQIAMFLTPQTDAAPPFSALLTPPESERQLFTAMQDWVPLSLLPTWERQQHVLMILTEGDGETITSQTDLYAYAPEDGWLTFSAALASSERRAFSLLLDGVVAQRGVVEGETRYRQTLPLSAGQFHTISLALDPACPAFYDPALECRSVQLADVSIVYEAAEAGAAARFEQGVTLARSRLQPVIGVENQVVVDLWWLFAEPLDENAVRFVHVTDAAGELVGQQDNPLGVVPAGEARLETVIVGLRENLPPGEYTISAGWYRYPEIVNFCVLSDAGCGANTVTLGTFTVE